MGEIRPRSRRSVRLRDIAEELDLSVSMVSKVLSAHMSTSGSQPKTAASIRAKAKELGYRKNMQALSLVTGRQNTIAVCLHDYGEPSSRIVEEMIKGIAVEAIAHQQRMILCYYSTYEELKRLWSQLGVDAVDGVIFGGMPRIDWLTEIAGATDQPVSLVTILPDVLAGEWPNIGLSDLEIGRCATRHLIECGCQKIVHLSVAKHFSAPEYGVISHISGKRREGYQRTLAEYGFSQSDEYIVEIDHFSFEEGCKGAKLLLARGIEFDGIFAQSDGIALGAMNVLIRHGIEVPHDVRIIGVDNAPICQMAPVSLSSVSQEYYLRGRRAMQTLLMKINNQQISSVVIDPILIKRDSTVS